MDTFIAQYKSLIDGFKLVTLFGLIALDTLLGIILAVKDKSFAWSKLASFLNTSVLMMAGGYFLVGVLAVFEPSYKVVVPVTWGLLDAKLIADIVIKLKGMGVPMPSLVKPATPPVPPALPAAPNAGATP